MNALMMQIDMAISTVVGTVTNAINAVMSLIDAVVSIIKVLANLPKLFTLGGLDIKIFLLSRDACEEVMASILACLLNKFFGDPIEKFKNKMIDKINEYGYTANQALADEFADINVVSAYVQQESFLLTKASYQMEGLYADFGVTMDVAPVAQANETKQADDIQVDKNGNVKAKGTKVSSEKTKQAAAATTTAAATLFSATTYDAAAANYMFTKGAADLASPLSINDPASSILNNNQIKITPTDGTISL